MLIDWIKIWLLAKCKVSHEKIMFLAPLRTEKLVESCGNERSKMVGCSEESTSFRVRLKFDIYLCSWPTTWLWANIFLFFFSFFFYYLMNFTFISVQQSSWPNFIACVTGILLEKCKNAIKSCVFLTGILVTCFSNPENFLCRIKYFITLWFCNFFVSLYLEGQRRS